VPDAIEVLTCATPQKRMRRYSPGETHPAVLCTTSGWVRASQRSFAGR
jgi:hypothetical protein